MKLSLGVDIGSTTAKIVVLRDDTAVFTRYARHFSQIRDTMTGMLTEAADALSALGIDRDAPLSCAMSGSAGMGLAEAAGVPFVQEVWATGQVVRRLEPDTDAVIELGGEDAKILFFGGSVDERMNGACAGGTGAFIDQMASLLDMTPDELDEASLRYEKLYPIASRCGVFAKTDVQPLLNQGARKEDVAASIYQAVVNQTISGLAQGRRITGKVMFLGGPLSFCKGLRDRFVDTLGLVPGKTAIFPDYARTACALGAAFYAETVTDARAFTIDSLTAAIRDARIRATSTRLPPLFRDRDEYEAFAARHRRATVPMAHADTYVGKAWLGIDCGSTTTKMVLIGEADEILFSYYDSNRGNPVSVVREQLLKVRELTDRRGIEICGCAVTGYGEELIKTAFHGDMGLVETMAHFTAARHFEPDVDFILDIGGQDIKCFRIKNGAIDSIMLNEACSSGCGSFIETFARSMGYSSPDFARLGLFAESPVNLGSRCTVFMNSQVKQSQKDGASVADISAGLSVSVVKNAIYKVIRAHSPDELGAHIVVQGGTFHNDAVLRAFERETGREVVRPSIAGLMGAYGAALRVKKSLPDGPSRLATTADLQAFRHTARVTNCSGCTNRCLLTVNVFADGTRCISGNKCEKPTGVASSEPLPDLYAEKRDWLFAGETFFGKKAKHEVLEPPAPPSKKLYEGGKDIVSAETGKEVSVKGDKVAPSRFGRIGLPMALGMYELYPLWHGVFTSLGFEVISSGPSSRAVYDLGHFSIPSDTACYPAKIMHGHMEKLLQLGCGTLFYPRLTYNLDPRLPEEDNHYNCPIVAYYSELLAANMDSLRDKKFLYPYLDINDRRKLAVQLTDDLCANGFAVTKREVKAAIEVGFAQYEAYMAAVRKAGEDALRYAAEKNRRVIVLAGRPYHIDPEICHGIDTLATSLGCVVVSEDAIAHLSPAVHGIRVLNQWVYHSRLYRAATIAANPESLRETLGLTKIPQMDVVQLVSFGCGVDAITTDEVRRILEEKGKFYTQIKIDEVSNLGAVKIRLRTLLDGSRDPSAE